MNVEIREHEVEHILKVLQDQIDILVVAEDRNENVEVQEKLDALAMFKMRITDPIEYKS